MSDLIPSIEWADFVKVVQSGQIGELKTCVLTLNGQDIFTAVIPHGDVNCQDYIKTQAAYLGVKANIPGGKDPSELASSPDEPILPVNDLLERRRAQMAVARAARQTKREGVGV